MSTGDEEPYSTIFASLKHPIRRRILRMLSKKPMSFSEMLEVLGVSSSFLNYHLENLGELMSKTDDGRYKLSSFGEAAIATITKVEDIPRAAPHHLPEMRPKKIVGRSVVTALGIICIVLVASLGTVIVTYTLTVTDKNTTISSLKSQIFQLNSTATNLQKQITSEDTTINSLSTNVTGLQEELNSVLNRTSYIDDMIMSDPSAWFNKTVIVEGNLSLYFDYNSSGYLVDVPLDAQLSSDGHSIVVFPLPLSAYKALNIPNHLLNSSSQVIDVRYVRIYGVVEYYDWIPSMEINPSHTYCIWPEAIELV